MRFHKQVDQKILYGHRIGSPHFARRGRDGVRGAKTTLARCASTTIRKAGSKMESSL
jgi:hypothetical protein